MRTLALLLLALALAAPALAQDNSTNETPATNETPPEGGVAPAGPITIELEGYQDGAATYFTLKGQTARNPSISVQPGQKVTFVFTAVSGFHNLNINGEVKTKVIGDGDSATLEWTAPSGDARVEYWCDPHKAVMKGAITVGAAAAPGGGGGEGGGITGDTIDLGKYSAACAGQVAPATAADGVVGMPSLQDYIDGCTPSEGPVTRATSGADFVIPFSWALIGLGVAGVVWVHKYYKP